MQTQTIEQQHSLLKIATVEQAAAKIGIFGPQGSGKTLTAALIALGLSKLFHNSRPVAFMDTENGSDYLVPIFKAEGVPLLNFKSRAFKDMCQGLKDAGKEGCCGYLVDSYTHPWRELNDALKEKLGVQKLEFRHMDQLKSMWMGWTDLMLNSQQHVIVSGRLGYVWDREEDEETGKKGDLIKLGTKMKSENEAGYEPSLLIEMEAIQDGSGRTKSRSKRGSITHYAYVLKDRWRTLNGRTFQWKDMNEYKVGGYKAVFETFLPHFSKLVVGQTQQAVSGRTSSELFNGIGESAYFKRAKQVQITTENIQGTLVVLWPGMDANSKSLKAAAIETLFQTRSWSQVEALRLEDLEVGLRTLELFEDQVKDGQNDAISEKGAAVLLLERCRAIVMGETEDTTDNYAPSITPTPAVTSEKPKRKRKNLDTPELISPRESMLLVSLAKRMGWTEPEFVSALVKEKGIAGPDFIRIDQYDDVLQFIEAGTEPILVRPVVLEGMQPCL